MNQNLEPKIPAEEDSIELTSETLGVTLSREFETSPHVQNSGPTRFNAKEGIVTETQKTIDTPNYRLRNTVFERQADTQATTHREQVIEVHLKNSPAKIEGIDGHVLHARFALVINGLNQEFIKALEIVEGHGTKPVSIFLETPEQQAELFSTFNSALIEAHNLQ